MKRVSWLTNETQQLPAIAIHEFKGVGPSAAVHGRTTTSNPGPYVRIKPKVMQKLKEDLRTKQPAQVYATGDELDGPRNKKQVYNAKARSGKGADDPKANFADQVSAVEELQHSLPFVRQIIRQHGKVPCIILHTPEQIEDLKRFCCPPTSCASTVLCVDKTYNLGDVHVTTTVYKNLSLLSRRSSEYPLFFGPMFLHGDSDTDSFFYFFSSPCWFFSFLYTTHVRKRRRSCAKESDYSRLPRGTPYFLHEASQEESVSRIGRQGWTTVQATPRYHT